MSSEEPNQREFRFPNNAPTSSAQIKQLGINHNLSVEDLARFHGVLEAPVRISETRIFHDFSIGAFSYVSGGFLYHTHIGRYCSLSNGLHIGQGNHPFDWLSSHPFQYQKLLFHVGSDFPDRTLYEDDVANTDKNLMAAVTKPSRTVIGNDVWIGHGAFVVNGVSLGDGCVVGGRAVVTKDLEPYSIAVGNPARIIRKRFPDNIIQDLMDVRWWQFAPWQLRHVAFNNVEKAIDQIREMRENGASEYGAVKVHIHR